MLTIQDYILIFSLGSLGGFISGFLGVGGGIIYVPILEYFLTKLGLTDDALVKHILANSLFTIIFSGAIASMKQYRAGNFYPREILQTAVPGMISAVAVTYLIQRGDWYSGTMFNYVFVIMLFIIASRMLIWKGNNPSEAVVQPGYKYSITGFFTGIVTAFSGLGGGVVLTPVFTDVLRQPIKKASSVSNGVIPLFAICVGIFNLTGDAGVHVHEWQIGYIILPVILPLVASAIVFAPVGVSYSHKVSHKVTRLTFAVFVLIVFIRTLIRILMA